MIAALSITPIILRLRMYKMKILITLLSVMVLIASNANAVRPTIITTPDGKTIVCYVYPNGVVICENL